MNEEIKAWVSGLCTAAQIHTIKQYVELCDDLFDMKKLKWSRLSDVCIEGVNHEGFSTYYKDREYQVTFEEAYAFCVEYDASCR